MYGEVLKFWFEEIDPAQWFASDPAFDAEIRHRFAALLQAVAQGEQYGWRSSARGRLAEIVVLDQFSRNLHRGTAQAFAQDPMALALAQEAVVAGMHEALAPNERNFLLMPYMHSESRLIHQQAEILFREFAPQENYDFELRHKAIIDRFGRYPHRNGILGRSSSAEELEFLTQPGSAF
ncbi:MAG: DUF924 domain-containing protein [Xanthomonadales bacterium]|nr:DUF924 domain-containing protein [Xanthomonadales bacterium]